MPIAIRDQVYEDEVHYNAAAMGIELFKEDTPSTPSTVPSTGTQKPADALKPEEGTQVPTATDSSPERYQTWPERMVRGAISAMALPGDVLSGKVQPGSPQEIEKAMDLAGLMVMGPAPVAAKLADGTLGSFAGVASKTIDKNRLAEAQIMQHNGASVDEIWEKTGFFKGADDRWKFEIPDNNATLKDSAFDHTITPATPRQTNDTFDVSGTEELHTVSLKDRFPANSKDMTLQELADHINKNPRLNLSEVIDHPELFKAYPHLNDIKVDILPKSIEDRGVIGQMDSHNGILYLKGDLDPSFAKSVILHEVQHSIQEAEGFAKGGSSLMFEHPNLSKAQRIYDDAIKAGGDPKDPALVKAKKIIDDERKDALDKYTRLMGEVEARNVQRRMDMNDRNRLFTPPDVTESIPRDIQIYKAEAVTARAEEAKLPDGYYDKVPLETRLSKSGTEPSHPGFRWEVYDPESGKVMRKDIMSRSGASKTQDNLDNKYGGYKYRVRMVKASSLTDAETKFLKDKDINPQ